MTPELEKQERRDAIASIQQYFERNMPEPVGELAAGLLLDFFLHDIGPVIFNQAIRAAQAAVQTRVSDLDADLYQAPFTYWLKTAKRSR